VGFHIQGKGGKSHLRVVRKRANTSNTSATDREEMRQILRTQGDIGTNIEILNAGRKELRQLG